MIERAEDVLKGLGFFDVRVRHHELKSMAGAPLTHLARIEVGPGELPKFLTDGLTARISEQLKEVGYVHVTLDLQGYRRGSTNEVWQRSR